MELVFMQGLYWFSLIFILGLLLSVFASRFKIPDVLLLILFGFVIKLTKAYDVNVLISSDILAVFSIFALVMIIFDSTSEFKLQEIIKLSPYTLKLTLIFLVFSLIFMTIFTMIFLQQGINLNAFLLSILFASIICGTSSDVILPILGNIKNKIIEILQFESVINTPLTVILPLVIFDFYRGVLQFGHFTYLFLAQIMTGLGTGLVVGFFSFKYINKKIFEKIAPLLIIAIALGTYALAEYLKGSGILAITVLGLMFGKMKIEKKVELSKFLYLFTSFLKIIVFILLGLLIDVPLTFEFIFKSFVLFLVYLVVRYYSVKLSFNNSGISFGERMFMSLNVPKGITVAIVAFILGTFKIVELEPILSLLFAFIFYSVVLSSIVSWGYKLFLKKYEPEEKTLKRLKNKKK